MRVLLQRPEPDWFGGGVVHVEKTREYLAALGVEANCTCDPEPDLAGYDIVHLFNTPKIDELFVQCANVQRQSKPLVFSSIYWDEGRLLECTAADEPPRDAALLDRMLANQLYGAILAEADAVLTASAMEQGWLTRDFGLDPGKARVVPLAAERFFATADAERFVQRFGLSDFVLCSAVLGPSKNQLRLIRALRDFRAPLALVFTHADREYEQRCRREAGPGVMFLGSLDQPELASAYAAAKVHALVSCYEPTGLSSLEAGLGGCSLVCTAHSPISEYVGNRAWYADPLDIASIRRAVDLAYRVPKSYILRSEILSNFTWERTARLTLAAYGDLLAARASLEHRKGDARHRWLMSFRDSVAKARGKTAQAISAAEAAGARSLPAAAQARIAELTRALREREAQLQAVTGTWAYRLHHRLATSLPARMIRRLRNPGPPPTFPAPRGPALDSLAARAGALRRILVIAEASAWHVRRALNDLRRALPAAKVVLAGEERRITALRPGRSGVDVLELTRRGYGELTGIYDAVIIVGRVDSAAVRLAARAEATLLVQYNASGYYAGSAIIDTLGGWQRRLRAAGVRGLWARAGVWLLGRVYAGYFFLWDLLRRKEWVEMTCLGCGAAGRAAVHWGPGENPPYATCARCGLVQLSERREEDQLIEIYEDAEAIRGYLEVREQPVTRARHEQILSRIERWMPPGRLLDVGCADGRFLEAARDHGWQVEGVESSPMLARLTEETVGGVVVHRGLAGSVELPREHFDAVNLCHLVEHVPDVPDLLRRCFEALKPGGVICIVGPNIRSFIALATRDEEHRCIRLEAGHVTLPTVTRLSSALRRQGFEVLEQGTQTCGRIHSVLWTSRLFRFLPAGLRRPIERCEPQLNEHLAEVGLGDELYILARKPSAFAHSGTLCRIGDRPTAQHEEHFPSPE